MTVTEQLSTLDNILAHGDITSLFQPIVSLSERHILGYEALTRGPSNTALHSFGGKAASNAILCSPFRSARSFSSPGQPPKSTPPP